MGKIGRFQTQAEVECAVGMLESMWDARAGISTLDFRTVRQRCFTSSFLMARSVRKVLTLCCTVVSVSKHRSPSSPLSPRPGCPYQR